MFLGLSQFLCHKNSFCEQGFLYKNLILTGKQFKEKKYGDKIMVKKVFGETVTTVTLEIVTFVTNVTNFTNGSIITVMCKMLLLKLCKDTYFTKS